MAAFSFLVGSRLTKAVEALLPRFTGREQDHLLALAEEAAGAGYDKAFNNHIDVLEDFKTDLQSSVGASLIGSTGASNVQADVNGLVALSTTMPRVTTYNAASAGKIAAVTTNQTIISAATGTVFTIYNDSGSSIQLTPDAGLTLRLSGTTQTGVRTLAARGMASIWMNSTTEAIINGSGLT